MSNTAISTPDPIPSTQNWDRLSSVVSARIVSATVNILDDSLGVGTVVGFNEGRFVIPGNGDELRGGFKDRGEVGSFCSSSIHKDKHECRVIHPLDFESASFVFPFSKGGLDVAGFELGRKAREGEDTGDGCGERHGVAKELGRPRE